MTQTATKPSRPADPTSAAPPPEYQGVNLMPFVAHLEELRRRIVSCVAAFIGVTGFTFFYGDRMIEILQKLAPTSTLFVQLAPGEVFMASIKLSTFTGLGLTLPIILYHVFRFISPGLEKRERSLVIPLLTLSLLLFTAGVVFGYKVILPLMLDFLLDYGQSVAHNQLSIASFLDFCVGFLFASGLVFELPLFLLFTAFMGLVNSQKLVQQWKWALIASFLLAAVITPSPDPFSQGIMALSLFALYGFSIGLIKGFGR
jgi:sec-independent protein translocase protein TatC